MPTAPCQLAFQMAAPHAAEICDHAALFMAVSLSFVQGLNDTLQLGDFLWRQLRLLPKVRHERGHGAAKGFLHKVAHHASHEVRFWSAGGEEVNAARIVAV